MKEIEENSLSESSIIGFSDSFSCCHNWKLCDYGRNGCVFEKSDPAAMTSCQCYQRNHSSSSLIEIMDKPTVMEEPVRSIESEQMSLF